MIGVLGGTFDPIHYGHLRPASEAKQYLGLQVVHVVPVALPPHRSAPLASAEQRLQMVELAVAEFPGLTPDDCEIRRGGVSYTAQTLEHLRANVGAPLTLLIGADAFFGLPTWYRWERLFELAHVAVMQRPGQSLPGAAALPAWAASRLRVAPEELTRRPAGGIFFVPVTPRDVSATRIRTLIARGETPPAAALPPAVWDYIRRNGIYRSSVS
jgi:nicotinate-nucleotide adenylyltransferase